MLKVVVKVSHQVVMVCAVYIGPWLQVVVDWMTTWSCVCVCVCVCVYACMHACVNEYVNHIHVYLLNVT